MKNKPALQTRSTTMSKSIEPMGTISPIIPLDSLNVKILSLKLPDEEPKLFTVIVSFFNQLILSCRIQGVNLHDDDEQTTCARGTINYDPADYEKMCLFADYPLTVKIQPYEEYGSEMSINETLETSITSMPKMIGEHNIMCCNIDILPVFLGDEENETFCVKKRMEPMHKPSALESTSWDCLPILTFEVSVNRNVENFEHHKVLKNANWMQLTLIGAYNMTVPYNSDIIYKAASRTPISSEENAELIVFKDGDAVPKKFNHTNFYIQWESLRTEEPFTKSNEKFICDLNNVQNYDNIDLQYYINNKLHLNSVLWGSCHRTLLLTKSSEKWLYNEIRKYKWPLEVHLYSENNGYSFMAMLNFFQLLYPGETKIQLAVPLEWICATKMLQACNCALLMPPNENAPSSTYGTDQKASRTDASIIGEMSMPVAKTGADDNNAFVLLEVKLNRALRKIVIPPHIPSSNIHKMLHEMEAVKYQDRFCTGLGQLAKDWQATVRTSASALRRVPYYGRTEFYSFSRQLSETRTRVELMTSFWQDAAIFVNNKFVVKQYLHSNQIFEELIMLAHICLLKIACETLFETDADVTKDADAVLKAARHARQMQDLDHAIELYMQLVVTRPDDGNCWRELSTCLKDSNTEWANVCLNKAVVLNPRHPLTLVSKGGMIFEENPAEAEIFFIALMSYYPFWTTAWIIASAYYYDRQQYLVSDNILEIIRQSRRQGETEEMGYARSWERELGDWWDAIPLLPGMNPYYDAADLLLRLRCVSLAEVCVARALTCSGETPAYFHLVALCCRLRGQFQDALCHINTALEKFGEVNYLRSLEAECYSQLGNDTASRESYEKAGCTGGPFSVLKSLPVFMDSQRIRPVLVDMVHDRPSAYSWMALADDWMAKAGLNERKPIELVTQTEQEITAVAAATAYAEQALRHDRLSGHAWAFLATVVKPSARRYYCLKMASLCGYKISKRCLESDSDSKQSLCYQLGKPVARCRCRNCVQNNK